MVKIREFFAGMARRHIWIAAAAALIIAFHLLTDNLRVMNAVSGFSLSIKKLLARLLSVFPFSFAELLCAFAVVFGIAYIIKSIHDIAKSGSRLRTFYRSFSFIVAIALSVYAALCIFLGASYNSDGFQAKSGLYAEKTAVEELYNTTEYFVDRLCTLSDKVSRNENGEFSEDINSVFSSAPELYSGVSEEYPFLEQDSPAPKKVFFSKLMSYFNYTGFYFPFTGEANINIDQPDAFIPVTIAHEMAHQRAIASEQEANFVAVLACTKSGNAVYDYSGSLLAFVHLGNMLYKYDREAYRSLFDRLPSEVKADLENNNEYWKQYENKAADISSAVYDTMLKNYGQALGVQSYGACVDLLIAYYRQYGAF